MKTISLSLFLAMACFADADPPKEPQLRVLMDSSKEGLRLRDILTERNPGWRVTVNEISALEDHRISPLFPDGKFQRASVVLVDPVSTHGALLDFVVFTKGADEVFLPLCGDRDEFGQLLESVDFRLDGEEAASKLAKAYSAIYRFELSGEPKVESSNGSYFAQLALSANGKADRPGIQVSFECDGQKRVVGVTTKLVSKDPK